MPKPIMPDLVYQLITVAGPHLAPEGSKLVFGRSQVDPATRESQSQIAMLDLNRGEPVAFTQGKRDSSPKFSPDGRTIAFLCADEKNRVQLWLIPVTGGECRQLTRMPARVTEFSWSPDSRMLAFVCDVDPERLPEDHDPKKDPRVKVVRRLRYRFDTLGWRGDAQRHIFVVAVDEALPTPVQITDGDWDDLSPVWSPDGQQIAFISGRSADRDRTMQTEAYVVARSGGEPRCWSDGLTSVASLAWSPGGSKLLVIGSADNDVRAFSQGYIYILATEQSPRQLTDDAIKPATGFAPVVPAPELRWTTDGRILFLGDSRGQSFLFEIGDRGGKPRVITGGETMITALTMDAAAQRAVMLSVPGNSAGDLRWVDVESGENRSLTDFNAQYFAEHPTARAEKFSIQRQGMEVESRLLFPPGFDPSKRYPLIVDVHGGPHGAFFDTFNALQQVLATAGYLVLCVNPRGSSTYGTVFLRAVLKDWGGEDYQDIMAAVDAVCSRPYVDAERLGVHGYSYGGFMSSWIVGHTNRFRAAVVGAPCIDLPSFYGTSDIGVSFGETQWGGPRFAALDAFLEHSPLTYASRVETPVLLLHGEEDHRCPIEQSEQFFVSLKRLGKVVEFVRFPGCSHLFLRIGHPRMREEYLARAKGWFDKYLGQ